MKNENSSDCNVSMLPLWQVVYTKKEGATTEVRTMQKPVLESTEKKRHSRAIHGLSKTKTHKVWKSMKYRCLNPNNKDFPGYGGRGIKVCERWLDFRNFIADMGMAPDGMAIDRIDNNGNYEPGNCEWTTRTKNCSHTRKTVYISAFGLTLHLAEWSRRTGISPNTITSRIKRDHWNAEMALSIQTI